MPYASSYYLTFIFTCLLITGCDQQQPETMLETYSNRVSNSIGSDAELDLDQHLTIPPYPRRRERILPVTDLRQGLLEVFNLRHCQLIRLVAERNSSLGKVMPPSRQIVYEIELYIGLRDCLQQLKMARAEPDLIGQVENILKIKDANLEASLWNGIFTSEAVERNFSLSEPALSLQGDNGFSQSRQALQALNSIAILNQAPRNWTRPHQLDNLEDNYKALHSERFGSRWLRSIHLLTRTLEHTAELIEQKMQQRPLCFNQQPTPKARIIKNVFLKYYAGQVQPYMSQVDQQGKEWLGLNQQLLGYFSNIPESMVRYQQQVLATDGPLWLNYLKARNRHTKAWQTLLGQCGLMPDRHSL